MKNCEEHADCSGSVCAWCELVRGNAFASRLDIAIAVSSDVELELSEAYATAARLTARIAGLRATLQHIGSSYNVGDAANRALALDDDDAADAGGEEP